MHRVRILLAIAFVVARTASAETTFTLNGTSGSNSIATTYTLSGSTTFNLGFFVDYLIVGGGGGGGGTPGLGAGGGGGGGRVLKYVTSESGNTGADQLQLSPTSYPISVGGGGAGGQGTTGTQQGAAAGGSSTAFGLTAAGGGFGASTNQSGGNGASGGGGNGSSSPTNGGTGTGGGNGGAGVTGSETNDIRRGGGGGGGAGGNGQNATFPSGTSVTAGNGGAGVTTGIRGTSQSFGGGGGGGVRGAGTTTAGSGAAGGGDGGDSNASQAAAGIAATSNTGGGGGGSGRFNTSLTDNNNTKGGDGGSGVVVVRYAGSSLGNVGGTIGTGGGYTWHSFNANGTFNLSAVNMNNRLGATLTGAIGGTGNLAYAGPGTLTLSAANTFTGSARATSGTLNVGHASALQNATLDLASGDAGTVAFTVAGPTTYTLGGLAGSQALSLDGNSLVVGGNNADTSYGGNLANIGAFVKRGAGNLVLSGSSTYTGPTTVNAGRLSVNGSLGNTPVNVTSGTLGGSGSIAGTVSIASGGFLSPGNSIASLATGTATFAAGATFAYEVDSTNPLSLGAAADLLVVSGNLTLDPGNTTLLTFADVASSVSPFVEDTTIFALINYSGSWNGGLFTYGSNVLTDGERFTVGSQLWEIDYNRTSSAGLDNFTADYLPSSNFVTVTAVPEPFTYAMALAGLTCGGYSMWRRRKRA